MTSKLGLIQRVREIYAGGGNLMAFLRDLQQSQENSVEDIMIAYDFQAGSYIAAYERDPSYLNRYTEEMSRVIRELGPLQSILEVGVGEATTLGVLARRLNPELEWWGFDVSWSRVRLGQDFARKLGVNARLFCADLFNIPLSDGRADLVYTSHSIEPNGGREEEAIRELARVAGKYLLLLEPAHDLASPEARQRMERHGYVRNLPDAIRRAGLELVEHRLFPVSANPLNPTGLYLIRVPEKGAPRDGGLICPISKMPLAPGEHAYFCPSSSLAYPVLDGVPCLLQNNAILATRYRLESGV